MKNRVEVVMIDFKGKTIDESINSFETKNYSIKKYIKIEYEVSDKFHKNNTRWISEYSLLQKLYFLEINKLESLTMVELVADIELLNKDFKNIIKDFYKMRTNLQIHIDKQNNKQSTNYRVRIVDKDIPNMRASFTKHFKTRDEAEAYELHMYRLFQFIEGNK